MKAKKDRTTKAYAYGLFAVSATIFTVGVLALSAKSYHHRRKAIIHEIDQSLLDAAYATKYILGHKVLGDGQETETPGRKDYSFCKQQLEGYAAVRGFDVLGAVFQDAGGNWNLIASADRLGIIAMNGDGYGCPVDPALNSILETLSENGKASTGNEAILHDYHDSLRIAVLHERISPEYGYALIVARNMDFVTAQLRLQALRELAIIIFLHIMAFPLVASFSRVRSTAAKRLGELDDLLKQDYEKLKQRETELQDAVHDLKRFNTLAVGREGRIIELKAEVNTLLAQLDREKRYNVDQIN